MSSAVILLGIYLNSELCFQLKMLSGSHRKESIIKKRTSITQRQRPYDCDESVLLKSPFSRQMPRMQE